MRTEGQEKQDQIVEVAIRRFSHFGISKTTLTEIADDVSMSRQSFLYYFHDKNALLSAVTEKVVTELLDDIEKTLERSKQAEEGLIGMLDCKHNFLNKYMLLAVQADKKDQLQSAEVKTIVAEAKSRHHNLISRFLDRQIRAGELKDFDTEMIAGLIIDTISAFDHSMRMVAGVPDEGDLYHLLDVQMKVLALLITGLKSTEWKG